MASRLAGFSQSGERAKRAKTAVPGRGGAAKKRENIPVACTRYYPAFNNPFLQAWKPNESDGRHLREPTVLLDRLIAINW